MTSPVRGAGDVIKAKVVASRVSQGLPPTVQDPGALERVAAVLRLVSDGGEPDAMRLPVQRRAAEAAQKLRTAAGGESA
jgi:hypothetical protein